MVLSSGVRGLVANLRAYSSSSLFHFARSLRTERNVDSVASWDGVSTDQPVSGILETDPASDSSSESPWSSTI